MRGNSLRISVMAAVLAVTSLVGLGTGPAHAAGVINVPGTLPTIQAAINAASAGDTVVVAPGVYHERIDFKGKAIEVKSAAGPASTIIDGDAGGVVVTFKTNETRASVLRGLTITDGRMPPMQDQIAAGGISVQAGSPTIVGNVVTANVGSGIQTGPNAALIQDNVIAGNRTAIDGGGILAGGEAEIAGNRIEDNVADSGGGLLVAGSAIVRDNVIRRNHAESRHGGGVAFYRGTVVDNLILDNTADVKGGGVLWHTNDPSPLIHNTIVGNQAPTGSGIADYTRGTVGGNIVVGPAGASVVSCLPTFGGEFAWAANDVYNGTGSAYQDCGGDPTGWNGNISADPRFVAPAASPPDYRLQAGSPGVDAGDPGLHVLLPATDFAGAPRITDGDGDEVAVADMGAHEITAAVVGGRYHPLQPARILDTRRGQGAAGPLGPGATMDLQVTGQGGVPITGVAAVVLNVAVTEPTAASFLTAWPAGLSLPLAANLNFVAGQTVPNLVVVKVGAGGRVSLYNNAGTTHLVADVAGWYGEPGATGGAKFSSVVPSRILDTRLGDGAPSGPIGPASTLEMQVRARG